MGIKHRVMHDIAGKYMQTDKGQRNAAEKMEITKLKKQLNCLTTHMQE